MIFLTIFLFLIILLLSFIIKNFLSKINIYENWVKSLGLRIQLILEKFDQIDAEGTFRSEDEVGFFWNSLNDILDILREYGAVEEEKNKDVQNEPTEQNSIRDNSIRNKPIYKKFIPKKK